MPGEALEIEIWLIEVSATDGTPYSFDLEFIAEEDVP